MGGRDSSTTLSDGVRHELIGVVGQNDKEKRDPRVREDDTPLSFQVSSLGIYTFYIDPWNGARDDMENRALGVLPKPLLDN